MEADQSIVTTAKDANTTGPTLPAWVLAGIKSCMECGITSAGNDIIFLWYNYIVIAIVLPMVGTFGALTNCISFFIFMQPKLRTSANTYLAALAISDLFVVTTAIFVFGLQVIRQYKSGVDNFFLKAVTTIFPMATIAQTCSVYITLAAGIDCYINVCVNRWKATCCTVRRARNIIIGIALWSLCYNLNKFFELNIEMCYEEAENITRPQVCATSLRLNHLYIKIYYTVCYTIIMNAAPLGILVVLNLRIIRRIRRMRQRRHSHPVRMPDAMPAVPDNGAAITLVMVVFLFISCNSMALILNFVEQIESFRPMLNYLVDISNLMVVVNSSVNILIYYRYNGEYQTQLIACVHNALSCASAPSGTVVTLRRHPRSVLNRAQSQITPQQPVSSPDSNTTSFFAASPCLRTGSTTKMTGNHQPSVADSSEGDRIPRLVMININNPRPPLPNSRRDHLFHFTDEPSTPDSPHYQPDKSASGESSASTPSQNRQSSPPNDPVQTTSIADSTQPLLRHDISSMSIHLPLSPSSSLEPAQSQLTLADIELQYFTSVNI